MIRDLWFFNFFLEIRRREEEIFFKRDGLYNEDLLKFFIEYVSGWLRNFFERIFEYKGRVVFVWFKFCKRSFIKRVENFKWVFFGLDVGIGSDWISIN